MKYILYAMFAFDLLICLVMLFASLLGADAPGELWRTNSMRLLIEISFIAILHEVRRG